MMPPARAAYDAIAADYEDRVAPSSWVRERLWERLDVLFPAGSRVLDVTAGTGLDTLHLLGQGVAVVACDLSPAMLSRLAERAPAISSAVVDLTRLEETEIAGPFDGLLSTFAGLNATSDLSGFARAAARLVRPGGVLFLHVLGRWRKGGRKSLTVRIAGIDVPHRLWSARELARTFAPEFVLSCISGQGILRPVDDAGRSAALARWERAVSELPVLRVLGTFVSLELIRRG